MWLSYANLVDIFYHVRQVAARVAKLVLVVHLGLPFGERRGLRKSATVRVVSYRLFFMTITPSLTIRSQFAIECIRRSNDHGVGQFGTKFGEEGTDRCKPNINTI